MELQIQSLEDRNSEILEYNKSLFRELCYYKDREQKIEHMLMVFSSYVQSTRFKEGDELTDLIRGIGLSQHPAMRMDEQDRSLPYSDPDDQSKALDPEMDDTPFKRAKVTASAEEASPSEAEFTVPEEELDRLLGSPS